jgi:hypothetical protein
MAMLIQRRGGLDQIELTGLAGVLALLVWNLYFIHWILTTSLAPICWQQAPRYLDHSFHAFGATALQTYLG